MIHLIFNEADLGAFTDRSSALSTLSLHKLDGDNDVEGPSQIVLRSFMIDDDVSSNGEHDGPTPTGSW
uniref:Uncharacterized protein n=1 Tax=Oryza meridionalis TaxID=40149 RepID=A0A0E0CQU5_9ORYZ